MSITTYPPLDSSVPTQPGNLPVIRNIYVTNWSEMPFTLMAQAIASAIDFPDLTVNFPSAFNVANFPSSQNVTVSNFPTSFQVSNFPSFPSNFAINNLPAIQSIVGTVAVSNFPTSTQVSNFPASFNIGNFPSTQAVSIAAAVAVTGTFWPTTQPVSGTFWPATQPISGAVSVSNFPATQPISGNVGVSNFPTSFQISNFPSSQPVTGPLTDAQLRATALAVSGTFWPATQPVSGTFWQTTQPVSQSPTANPRNVVSVFATIVGNTQIIAAPGAGLSIYVKSYTLSSSLGTTVNPALTEGVGGTIRKKFITTAAFNLFEQCEWKLPANTALVLNTTANNSTGVQVNVEYYVV